MSLREVAYQLAKQVQASPHRDELRDLVWSLNTSPRDPTETKGDRSRLGYFARRQGAQLLGYLLVDHYREEVPLKVRGLDPHEKALIGSFHRDLIDLNAGCIEAIRERVAVPREALDPYSQFRPVDLTVHDEVTFLPDEGRKTIVEEFEQHPAAYQAMRLRPSEAQSVRRRDYSARVTEQVLNTRRLLDSLGVHETPDELGRIALHEPKGSRRKVALQYAVALVAMRASLQALNQMLFQALLLDQLPVLSPENVIKIVKRNVHVIGRGLTVLSIPQERPLDVAPGSLVLLLGEVIHQEGPMLCRVHGMRESFSAEEGSTRRMSMRILDDFLNAYWGLIDRE